MWILLNYMNMLNGQQNFAKQTQQACDSEVTHVWWK